MLTELLAATYCHLRSPKGVVDLSGHCKQSGCSPLALGAHAFGAIGQNVALRAHCVHTAHAEARILTQEYLSPDWLHSEAAKPT